MLKSVLRTLFYRKENDIWAIISNTLLKTNVITHGITIKNKFGQKYLKLHWMAGLTVLTAMAL